MFERIIKYNIWSLLFVLILAMIISVAILKPSWQIGGDGFGYYSYVRSFAFDGDFQFNNEFSLFDSLYHHHTVQGWRTSMGKIGNPFAVGAAILWLPFILIAKFITSIGHFVDPFFITGYNLPFQISITLGTWCYFLLGIILTFKTLNNFVEKKYAWLSILCITAISPLPFYLIYEPSMSHGLTFFSTALLFYFSIKLYKEQQINYRYLALAAFSLGLTFLIRWQDVLLAIIPLGIIIDKLSLTKNWQKYFVSFLIFVGVFFFSVLPQLVMWHYLYGAWISVPQGASFFDLAHPHIWQLFFSSYHGFFIIHPLLIFGIIGLWWAYKKNKYLIFLLIIALILETYINSALFDWYGGGSFGARRMISTLFIFIFGLAYLLKEINKIKLAVILFSIIIFIGFIFNGLLMMAYARKIMPLNAFTPYQEVYYAPIKVLLDL